MNIAILVSGNGSTAEAIIRATQTKMLRGIYPVIVISSKSNVYAVVRARQLKIPVITIDPPANSKNQPEFGKKINEACEKYRVDLISQNGWLPLTPVNVIEKYKDKIINQHPGPLDPGRIDFGGKGMFGTRVIATVLAYHFLTKKMPYTESTVHFVEKDFDKGQILKRQKLKLPYLHYSTIDDLKKATPSFIQTVKELQPQFLKVEYSNVIGALQQFADNTVQTYQRPTALVDQSDSELLQTIKEYIFTIFPNG